MNSEVMAFFPSYRYSPICEFFYFCVLCPADRLRRNTVLGINGYRMGFCIPLDIVTCYSECRQSLNL
jgi:hypothetical protein